MRWLFPVLAGLLLLSPAAFGQDSADYTDECQVDSDCPTQFVCRTVQVPCSTIVCEPCECDAVCADDSGCGCVCPVCDVTECTGDEYKVCSWEPVDCTADGDCPAGFECQKMEICSGVACTCPACQCDPTSDPGCECPDVPCDCGDLPEPECVEDGGLCMPKPVECTVDDDCADGFTCVASGGTTPCLCPQCNCMPCAADAGCPPCDCDASCSCDDAATTGPSYCMPSEWNEYVEFRDGEPAYEGLLSSDSGLVPIQDGDVMQEDTGGGGGTNGGSDSNCSAGSSGTFPWLLFLPIVVALIFRRRGNC